MTYHTYKCPHCKAVVGRATGDPSRLGNPFHICPFCGGTYVDNFSKEWATLSRYKRFMYRIDKSLALGFLCLIGIAGLLATMKVNTYIALIIGLCSGMGIAILHFFARRYTVNEEIEKSIERTKSKKYVSLLKAAGFKFHKIKGVEVGSINDLTDYNSDEVSAEIESVKDSSYSHH